MYRTSAIQKLRDKLAAQGLHAMIIPTNDPHFGEYTQDYYKVRAYKTVGTTKIYGNYSPIYTIATK